MLDAIVTNNQAIKAYNAMPFSLINKNMFNLLFRFGAAKLQKAAFLVQ